MNQSLTPLDPLLITIVLVTLAIGLPILVVLSIRFLWDRNLNLGRSKELEKAHLAVAPHRQRTGAPTEFVISSRSAGHGRGSRSCLSPTDSRPTGRCDAC